MSGVAGAASGLPVAKALRPMPTRRAAYQDALYTVLVTLAKVLAPVLPFIPGAITRTCVRMVDATAPESIPPLHLAHR